MANRVLSRVGGALARYLSEEREDYAPLVPADHIELVRACLQPCDVLLVEGSTRFSVGIKYLTQSTWSHAACFVGPAQTDDDNDPPCMIEADVVKGVIQLPLTAYAGQNVRICRPVGLTEPMREQVVEYMRRRIGDQYDLKNVFDLARWLFPTPPIPMRFRRDLMKFGSGDPTRAICSTLIAQAFQSVRYPILPKKEERVLRRKRDRAREQIRQVLHLRHHSLFAPRDFDLSPYFKVIKPTIEGNFDPASLVWADQLPDSVMDPDTQSTVDFDPTEATNEQH